MVITREKTLTPGTEACSSTVVAESLNETLARLANELGQSGGVPPQHELRFSTTGGSSEITISVVARSDASCGQCRLTEFAETRDAAEHDKGPADRVDWERPVADVVTDGVDTNETESGTSANEESVLIRFEPTDGERVPGGTRVSRPPIGESDTDGTVADLLRVIGSVSGEVLLRAHLEPAIETDDRIRAAEDYRERGERIESDVDEVTPVGVRPSIDLVVRAGEDSIRDATRIGEALRALVSIEDLVPVRYASSDVRANPRMNASTVRASVEQVRRTIDRMNACRGRPVNPSESSSQVICDPEAVAELYRVPSADRLLEAGVSVNGIEDPFADLPRSAREKLLSSDGLRLGTPSGRVDTPLRFDESSQPATEVVVSDDAAMRARLLARRTVDRCRSDGTTVVLDTNGVLSSIFRARDWDAMDDIPVSVWSTQEYPPRVPLFPVRALIETGWSRDEAIEFVTTTHDALLDASASSYRRSVAPETLAEESAPAVRDLYRAVFDECAPGIDYQDVIAALADEATRNELDAYNARRFDEVAASAEHARVAVRNALELYDTMEGFLEGDQTKISRLSELPDGIVCLDASGYSSKERSRLNVIAVARVLSVAVATADGGDRSPLTVVFDEIGQFGGYDFLGRLRNAATADVTSSVELVFGLAAGDTGLLPRHRSLAGTSSMYSFALTGDEIEYSAVEQITARVPDVVPIDVGELHDRIARAGAESIHLAADTLPNPGEGVSFEVAHPPLPPVPDDAASGPAEEPAVPSTLYRRPETGAGRDFEAASETASSNRDDDAGIQVRLGASSSETVAEDGDVSGSEGVVQTVSGPACVVCGRVYDCRAMARRCHTEAVVTDRRRAISRVADNDVDLPSIAATFRQDEIEGSVPPWVGVAVEEQTMPDVFRALNPHVTDSDAPYDALTRSFLAGLELARVGCLPGYTLADSMVTLREGCLSNSKYSIEDLLAPSADVPFGGPVLCESRFQGRRYYELTPQARQSDALPGLGDQAGPILGTGLDYNQCAALGVAELRERGGVEWVTAPAASAATGVDAFAGYTDQDELHTVGTVVADDPLAHDAVAEYVVAQHDRMTETTANAVWVTPNSTIARATLDVLADADAIDLSPTLADSQYSASDLQRRFLGETTPGIDHLTTRAQLLL